MMTAVRSSAGESCSTSSISLRSTTRPASSIIGISYNCVRCISARISSAPNLSLAVIGFTVMMSETGPEKSFLFRIARRTFASETTPSSLRVSSAINTIRRWALLSVSTAAMIDTAGSTIMSSSFASLPEEASGVIIFWS